MVSAKELLAQRLKQNTEKHQQAQSETTKDNKEFRRNILIEDISRSRYQPRKTFLEDELQKLADSISEIGLLQPISVRKLNNSKYELIAGERRLKAHDLLNKKTIEAIVIDVDDSEAALLTLAENLKRQDLSDYEIYVGITLLDSNIRKNKQKLAKSLGMNREDMYKYLSYEKLPKSISEDLEEDPKLLGRTAATAFKKFLSDHMDDFSEAEKALLEAWEKVKTKRLEQTKAAAYAQKILNKCRSDFSVTPVVRKLEYEGKTVGNISLTENSLKVLLNISKVNESNLLKLESLLKNILADNQEV